MITIYKHYINKTGISKAFEETKFEGAIASEEPDTVISLTDYNKLREILGYEKVNLQDSEIIINCLKTVKVTFDNYIKDNRNINIVGKDLTIKEIRGENLAQIEFNGYYYLIIVPDSLIHDIEKEDRNLRNAESNSIYFDFLYNLVVTTKEMTDQKFYDDLCNFIIKEEKAITDEINGEEEEYTMEISLGMLILVYGIYFIATDVQFNRNINEAIR